MAEVKCPIFVTGGKDRTSLSYTEGFSALLPNQVGSTVQLSLGTQCRKLYKICCSWERVGGRLSFLPISQTRCASSSQLRLPTLPLMASPLLLVRVKVTFRKIPPNYTVYFNPDPSIDVNQENIPSFGTLKYPPSVE